MRRFRLHTCCKMFINVLNRYGYHSSGQTRTCQRRGCECTMWQPECTRSVFKSFSGTRVGSRGTAVRGILLSNLFLSAEITTCIQAAIGMATWTEKDNDARCIRASRETQLSSSPDRTLAGNTKYIHARCSTSMHSCYQQY